jgi:hypothetical protein
MQGVAVSGLAAIAGALREEPATDAVEMTPGERERDLVGSTAG